MLPYSREVYYSLFAELNTTYLWAQVAGLLLALALAFACERGGRNARCFSVFALAALWAGLAYFWFGEIFSEINFLASLYATLAGFQALAILLAGLWHRGKKSRALPAWVVHACLAAAFLWPLLDVVFGPGWPLVRLPGLHLAPLLFLSLPVILRFSLATTQFLLLVPLLLSGVAAFEAYVLGIPQNWLLPATALGAYGIALKSLFK